MAKRAPHSQTRIERAARAAASPLRSGRPIAWTFVLLGAFLTLSVAAARAVEIRDVRPTRPRPLVPETPPAGWMPPPLSPSAPETNDPISVERRILEPRDVESAPPKSEATRTEPAGTTTKVVTERVVVQETVEPLSLTPEMVAVPMGTVERWEAEPPAPTPATDPEPAAARAPPTPKVRVAADRPLAHIEEIWFNALPRIQAGDVKSVDATVETLRSLMDDSGIMGLPVHAMALLQLSRQYADRGDFLGARALARAATELDPTTGKTWEALVHASLRGPDRRARDVLHGIAGWSRSLMRSRARQAAALGNVVFYVLTAALLFSAFLIGRPAARGLVILNHRLGELLPENVPPWLRIAGLTFAVLVPLVFPGGLGWFAFGLIALITPALWNRERRRLALVVATLALTGPLVAFCASFEAYLLDPGLQVISEASEGVVTPRSLDRATRALRENAKDPALWGAKAQFLKLAGDLDGAANAYRHGLALAPESTWLLNNLGNIALVNGDDELAGKLYRKAARTAPGAGAVQFNLGQYHRSIMDFNAGETAFRRARRLDPQLVGAAVVRVTADERHNTVDLPIDAETWWRRFFQSGPTREQLERVLWGRFFPYVPLWLAPALALGSAAFLASGKRRRAREVTGLCARCGVVAPVPYREGEEELGTCASCRSLAEHPKDLAPELRRRHLQRIERFQSLRRGIVRWAAALVPGSGHWLAGKRWRGGLIMGAFFLLLVKWFAWAGHFDYSHWTSSGATAVSVALFAAATAGLYWLSIRRLPKL